MELARVAADDVYEKMVWWNEVSSVVLWMEFAVDRTVCGIYHQDLVDCHLRHCGVKILMDYARR